MIPIGLHLKDVATPVHFLVLVFEEQLKISRMTRETEWRIHFINAICWGDYFVYFNL